MEVQDLTNNKGLLPLELGTARTIRTYNNLIHIVKLDDYRQNIDKIKDSLRTLNNTDGLTDSIELTKFKLKELENRLHALTPRSRNRRGLINGLGTIIKAITGNMDANDAKKLNDEIETIMLNEKTLQIEINRQTQINGKMIERFGNVTKHINSQQVLIKKYLEDFQDQLRNKIRSENSALRLIQFLNQINYNIDLLNMHLTGIAEAVTLARLNIISKHILSPQELSELYLFFEKQSVNIKTDENIYEFLGLQAYFNDTNIIFNIRIPVIPKDSYSLFHIIPLPIHNNKIIKSKPYVLINPNYIQFLDAKCNNIERTFYCHETFHREETKNSRCIGNLITNKPASCELQEETTTTQIIQPEPNYLLLINVPESTFNTTCGPANQKINGTVLIHFENCDVTINQVTYEAKENIFWDEINIFPTIFNDINVTFPNNSLQLDDFKPYTFSGGSNFDLLNTNTYQINLHTSTAIVTIILAIILITYLAARLNINICNPKNLNNQPPTTIPVIAPSSEPAKIQFLWPALNSKGGGVMVPSNSST